MLRSILQSIEVVIPEIKRHENRPIELELEESPSESRHAIDLQTIIDYGYNYGRGVYTHGGRSTVISRSQSKETERVGRPLKRSDPLEKGARSAPGSRKTSRRPSPVRRNTVPQDTQHTTQETEPEMSGAQRAEFEKRSRQESERKKQAVGMGVAVHIVHTILGEQIPLADISCDLIHTISCMVVPILRTFGQAGPELVFYSTHLLTRMFPSPIPSLVLPCDANGHVEEHLTSEQLNQVAVIMVRTWMICLRLSFSWMHDRFYPLADWAYWTHLPPTILSKAYIQLLHILNHDLCIGSADWIIWLKDLKRQFEDFCTDLEWTLQQSSSTQSPSSASILKEAGVVEKLQALRPILSKLEKSTMQVFLSDLSPGLNSANDNIELETTPLAVLKQKMDLKKAMKERFMEFMRSDLPKSLDPSTLPFSNEETSLEKVDIDLKADKWPERWPWATLARIMEEREKARTVTFVVEDEELDKTKNQDEDPEGRIFDLEIISASGITVCQPEDIETPALTPDIEPSLSLAYLDLPSDDDSDIPCTPDDASSDDEGKENPTSLRDSFRKLQEFVIVEIDGRLGFKGNRGRSMSWDSSMVTFAPRNVPTTQEKGRGFRLTKPLHIPRLRSKKSVACP